MGKTDQRCQDQNYARRAIPTQKTRIWRHQQKKRVRVIGSKYRVFEKDNIKFMKLVYFCKHKKTQKKPSRCIAL